MAETEFEKWIREKEAKRGKARNPASLGRGKGSRASRKRPEEKQETDPVEAVKSLTVVNPHNSEVNTTVSQGRNIRKEIVTKSGTAQTSVKDATTKSLSRKQRRQSRKEDTSSS